MLFANRPSGNEAETLEPGPTTNSAEFRGIIFTFKKDNSVRCLFSGDI